MCRWLICIAPGGALNRGQVFWLEFELLVAVKATCGIARYAVNDSVVAVLKHAIADWNPLDSATPIWQNDEVPRLIP